MKYRPLVCLTLIHVLVDSYAQVWTPLWPELKRHLSVESIALLYAVWQLSASMSQPLFGYFGDRLDGRRLVVLGPGVAFVCICLIGVAPGPTAAAVLLFVGGLGIGAFHPEAAVAVVEASGARITRGLALFTFGGMLGLGLGPLVSGAVAEQLGLPRLIWLAPPGLILLGMLALMRGSSPAPHQANGTPPRFSEVLHGRPGVVLLLLAVATLRVVPALGLPFGLAFLLDGRGWTSAEIGRAQSIFLWAGGVGTLACPLLARAGRELGATVAATLLAAGLLVLVPFESPWLFYLGLAGSGFLLQGTIPLLIAYSQRLLPRGRRLAASLTLGASWGIGGLLVAGLQAGFNLVGRPEGMLWAMVPFAVAAAVSAALLPRERTGAIPLSKPA